VDRILELQDVGFRYEKNWVVRGIRLQIKRGTFLGIVGPNGSGKSTLLKIMDGILHPQEGDVLFEGISLMKMKRTQIAKKISMVTQETHFHFNFSVLEVVLMGRFPHLGIFKFEGKRDLDIAKEALRLTDSIDFAHRPINTLSGGEKQRVLLAKTLAQEPEIVLLDEPTTFLDLRYKTEIFEIISSLIKEMGLTVVVVSHDIDLVSQYCKEVLLLKDGKVFDMGTPKDVINSENLRELFDCQILVDLNPITGTPRVNLIGGS